MREGENEVRLTIETAEASEHMNQLGRHGILGGPKVEEMIFAKRLLKPTTELKVFLRMHKMDYEKDKKIERPKGPHEMLHTEKVFEYSRSSANIRSITTGKNFKWKQNAALTAQCTFNKIRITC